MDYGMSENFPREEHRRPDNVEVAGNTGDTIGVAPPLSQRGEYTYVYRSSSAPEPVAVARLRYATEELSDYLRQLAGDAARDLSLVNIERLLHIHHAVCEGLAEIRQWEA